MWPSLLLALVLAVHILAGRVPAGEVYRWRDASGVLHFSDTPPVGPAEEVRSSAAATVNTAPSRPSPAKDAPGVSGGVFWRIDPTDRSPSYLLGTIHSADPRVTTIKPTVTRALEQARVFVMEMDLNVDSFLTLGAAMMFTDGRDLAQLLGPDDFRQVAAAVSPHGIPEQLLRRMKPWAVLALISQPAPQSGAFMDMVLYQKATAAGKPVFGLESAQEQIAVFNQMPMKDQLALLRSGLNRADQMPALQHRMIEIYLKEDLAAIAALSAELVQQDPSGINQRFMYRLNDARNDRMLTRMIPHIDTGGAFIAVGALHLTGERGLVRQLRARGYRLSPAD